jgi:predicted dehydrogenase
MRFGLIGAGGIAQSYVLAFQKRRTAELVGICDINLQAAKDTAEKVGAQAFDDYMAMCNVVQPDAVIVCTPPTTHEEICVELLRSGHHVLCEKPLSISSDSAARMIETSNITGNKFTMASKFRYVHDVIKARELVNSGAIGDIILFENAFTSVVDMSNRWNSNPNYSGGGVLIDNGTHSVDIMRYFLGPVVELQVIEGRRVQNLQVEDTVRVFVRSEEDVMGSIDLSWSMQKEQPWYISLYGSKGTILVGWGESKYRLQSETDWNVFGTGYDKVQAFCSQIENFAAHIRGEEELLITSADGLASVQVIEAAYESLRCDNWQNVVGNADKSLVESVFPI